jgi:flagellar hook-associated protein 2
MTSATTAATVQTSSSGAYVSSTASGLDTEALIDAAVAQKTARADTIEQRISAAELEIAAYDELETLLTALSDAAAALAANTTGQANAFDALEAYITGAGAEDTIAVSVEDGASIGEHSISVEQLAMAMKVASATQSRAALGLSGVFEIAAGGGETATVTVAAEMTLADLAAAINAASEDVTATVLNTGADSAVLVLASADTGKTLDYNLVSGADVLSSIGVADSAGGFANVVQEAKQAIVYIDGARIESDSNDLDGVLDGVSITLVGVSSEAVTLEIAPDYAAAKQAILDVIEAYNGLRDFLGVQSALDASGQVSEEAVLYADALLRSVTSQIANLVTHGEANSEINSLEDLGLVVSADNKLELDSETTLDSVLLGAFAGVSAFFADSVVISDSALHVLRNEDAGDYEFTLDLAVSAEGVIEAVTVNGQSGLFTVSGNRIIGVAGAAFEGLVFSFVGDADVSIDISIKTGLATKLNAVIDRFAGEGGLIENQISSLQSLNDERQIQADAIRERGEAYRERLVDKYAKMEAELEAAELLAKQIRAILGGGDDED